MTFIFYFSESRLVIVHSVISLQQPAPDVLTRSSDSALVVEEEKEEEKQPLK